MGTLKQEDKKLNILLLEDTPYDAELIIRTLKKGGLNFVSRVVGTKNDFEDALKAFSPDVLLSDHSLPQFNSQQALQIARAYDPLIPFILVTATVSEEFAVEILKEGADDYLLKKNLTRLPVAILHAIQQRQTEEEKIQIREKLVQSEKQIRGFAGYLHHAQEEERSRIAREIHDELGQQLAGFKINLSMLRKYVSGDGAEILNDMMKEIDVTIQSMKRIATQLRPGILDTLGLIPSIEWMTKEFEKKTNIRCRFVADIREEELLQKGARLSDSQVSTCLFRICQEALTNVLKHAMASEVNVQMRREEDAFLLEIADNGKGMATEKLENPFSMGLIGMRERAKIIGAELHIESTRNSGTRIHLKTNFN